MRRLLFKSLVHGPLTEAAPLKDEAAMKELAAQLDSAARRRLGRTLSIREVDAGSCNGCELEIHALNNVLYDLERFEFGSSPRRAMRTCCQGQRGERLTGKAESAMIAEASTRLSKEASKSQSPR
jgi:hypothetical protein